jgi:hypothetical protein
LRKLLKHSAVEEADIHRPLGPVKEKLETRNRRERDLERKTRVRVAMGEEMGLKTALLVM